MTDFAHVLPLERSYPSRLRSMDRPPATLTVRGGPVEAACAVAIVGSRGATQGALDFARDLATTLVQADAVVVSGGAFGIDRAAHDGALRAAGRTWAVAGTGCEQCYPPDHAGLFETIGRGPGAMLWPFPPTRPVMPGSLKARNRVLVELADAVVVVQAGWPSGALHAAGCARRQGRPLWVVPAAPWAKGFEGSRWLLEHGARPLTRVEHLMRSLGLPFQPAPPLLRAPSLPPPKAAEGALPAPRTEGEDPIQIELLRHVTAEARHADEIACSAHMAAHAATAALLTLALQAVVVEGPPGFFRRSELLQHSKIADES